MTMNNTTFSKWSERIIFHKFRLNLEASFGMNLVWSGFAFTTYKIQFSCKISKNLNKSANPRSLKQFRAILVYENFLSTEKERMSAMTDSFCTWLFVRPLPFFLLTSSDWKATVIMAIKTFRKKKGAIAMYTMKKMEMPGLLFFLGPWSTPTLDTAESRILQQQQFLY